MKKFRVYVTRSYVHSATIEVKAENKQQAKLKALNEIGNTDLSISHSIDNEDSADVINTY